MRGTLTRCTAVVVATIVATIGCTKNAPSQPPAVDAAVHVKPRIGGSQGPGNADCKSTAPTKRRGGADLIATGICADPAQRASYGQEGRFQVAVNAVSTKRSDGTAVVSQADVVQDLATANLEFSRGGITIVLASYSVSDTIPSHITDSSVGNDPIFKTTDTLAVLYVETYYDGGGVSWNNGTGVIVDRLSRNIDQILAHEIGHSLGLQHTDYCASDADGDGVSDTPLDPGRGGYDCANHTATGATCQSDCSSCPCKGVCTAPLSAVTPDVNNIMAKYNDNRCTEYFTAGQFELMRCILRTQQRPRLRCAGKKQPCGDPVDCVSLTTTEHCGSCNNHCASGRRCVQGRCTDECDEECAGTGGGCVYCCSDCEGNPLCGVNHAQCSHIPACDPHYQCP